METLASLPLLGPVLFWVLPVLVVLTVVVAVHEYGHLQVGRWCGIRAEVFSIGFGKVLWSRTDRQGTRWQIAALPLGGYVKFLGDMDPASAGRVDDEALTPEEQRHAFHNAPLWKRTATVLAGPAANLLLSALIFFGLAVTGEKASDEPVIATIAAEFRDEVTGLEPGDRVLAVGGVETPSFTGVVEQLMRSNGRPVPVLVERGGERIELDATYTSPPVVTSMLPDGAAIGAGLRPGDRFLAVDGQPVQTSRDVQLAIAELRPDEPVSVLVEREGATVELQVTPKLRELPHPETGEVRLLPFLGIGMHNVAIVPETVPTSVGESASYAVERVWRIMADTVLYLKELLFNGADPSHLAGPIGIAKFSAQAASQGGFQFLQFVAFLSTAIGFFNLFPIPVLDGGHLMFYLAEAIRGRPNNETVVRYGTMAGLSLLLLLMFYVTFNNDLGLGAWLS